MSIFSDEAEALDWLDSLRKYRNRCLPGDPDVFDLHIDAVRFVGTLRFNGTPIERARIAVHSGLSPVVIDSVLDALPPNDSAGS